MSDCMLSTIDNPFSPFTQFDDWYIYDTSHGYNSCNFLARVAQVSSDLSDAEYGEEVENAIDEIVRNDLTDTFVKVFEHDFPSKTGKTPPSEG